MNECVEGECMSERRSGGGRGAGDPTGGGGLSDAGCHSAALWAERILEDECGEESVEEGSITAGMENGATPAGVRGEA